MRRLGGGFEFGGDRLVTGVGGRGQLPGGGLPVTEGASRGGQDAMRLSFFLIRGGAVGR